MAWFKKRNVDTTTSIPLARLATPSQISSYIKKLINASQYEYHESEALEVKEIIINEIGDRDSIRGVFLNSGEDPGIVKSLMPNIVNVPVVGEHVVCVEYNGQYYYTSVINRNNSINENAIPGVAGGFDETKKFGKDFERKEVKQLKINEGSIMFEGRHGQSVHLDRAGDHTPQILMRTHKTFDDNDDEYYIRENIDTDDSSIYLVSNGLSTINFDDERVEGKKVLIKSNGIFISGREEVRINAPNLSVVKDEVKLGNRDAEQSVIRGEDFKKALDDIISDIDSAFRNSLMQIKPAAPDGGVAAVATFSTAMAVLKTTIASKAKIFLSKTVKTV